MIFFIKRFILFSLILILPTLVQAGGKIKTKASFKKKQKLSLSSSYSFTFDAAEEIDVKTYYNTVSLSGNYSLSQYINLGASMGVSYLSFGDSIDVDRSVNLDKNISLSVKFLIPFSKKSKFNLGSSINIPNDFVSRVQGIKSISSISGGHSYRFSSLYSISSQASYHYIWNDYYYSPVSPYGVQKDSGISFSISNSIRLFKKLILSISGSLSASHYLDGNNVYGGNTTNISISSSYKKLSFSVFHIIGTHSDDKEWTTWYVDEYRKIIGLSLSYVF